MRTIIESIKATEVIVPSKPDSLNSNSVLDKDEAFAKKFLTGASWTEFAVQPKWIIEIVLQNGLIGIGETYRSSSKELIETAIKTFIGLDILKINWRRLPVTDQRIYEAFETAILMCWEKFYMLPSARYWVAPTGIGLIAWDGRAGEHPKMLHRKHTKQ